MTTPGTHSEVREYKPKLPKTKVEQLAKVVELAILTEDLDRSERKALLEVAHDVDKKRNHNVTGNKRFAKAGSVFAWPLFPISRLAQLAGCPGCKVCDKWKDWEPFKPVDEVGHARGGSTTQRGAERPPTSSTESLGKAGER